MKENEGRHVKNSKDTKLLTGFYRIVIRYLEKKLDNNIDQISYCALYQILIRYQEE